MTSVTHKYDREDFIEIEAEDSSGIIHSFSMDISDLRKFDLFQEKFFDRVDEIINRPITSLQTRSHA